MTKLKIETRAQAIGVKPGALSRQAARFVDKTRDRVRKIAYDWNDIDGSIDFAATDLERALDDFEEAIKDAVALLNEPWEQDEQPN